MSIDIEWEDERGERLAHLPDPDYLVMRFLPQVGATGFTCLGFVDPAGDTVFNQAQITQFVSELERLLSERHAYEPRVRTHLQAVLEFVRQAIGQAHTYIKFYGD
ncbi:MAG TPA: hypothetical protein VN281_07490 [Verrucomicrobiae bacterium]|jgi:hypothetical protein|nr:hypothetical protein [Verrucomicrobiae bacterium]